MEYFLGLYILGWIIFSFFALREGRMETRTKLIVILIGLVWPLAVILYLLDKDA